MARAYPKFDIFCICMHAWIDGSASSLQRTRAHARTAILSVGVVRGLIMSKHRKWLGQLAASTAIEGVPPDVFAALELADPLPEIARVSALPACRTTTIWDESSWINWTRRNGGGSSRSVPCRCSEPEVQGWLADAFASTVGHLVVRLLSSVERAEQARGARDRQLFQFYKTFVAFGLLEARERETGARYSLVLRTRIDSSSGTNWISKSLQANWFKLALARGVEPGSVRLANDYSWLAVRRDAERLARIWPEQIAERCGDCTANLSLAEKGQMICPDFWPNGSNAALELIDLCSAEASAWSGSCSNLLAKTPIRSDPEGMGFDAKSVTGQGAGCKSTDADVHARPASAFPIRTACHPKARLAIGLFAAPSLKATCLSEGPNSILFGAVDNKTVRKRLPC